MSDDTIPAGPVPVTRDAPPDMREIGATGLKRVGGRVEEEFLRELIGDKGRDAYREMSSNDGIVGGILFAVEMIIRAVDWAVIPGGSEPGDAEAADFLASNLDDMSNDWSSFITEALSMLPYGWAFHEIVPKRRIGLQPDRPGAPPTSKYDDNRIGIRKLPIRAQESLTEWIFDAEGGIAGLVQRPAPTYDDRRIPIQKAILFRTTAAKGNPEGRSILRTAYRSHYFKRAMQEIEAIGVERDLAGLPYAGIPAHFFLATAKPEERQAVTDWVETMRDIRRDSLQGLVYPLAYDANGNKLYDVGLMTTAGSRQIDTDRVIQRYNVEMASTILADFILLGHEKVGSFALASEKADLFSTAVNGWLQSMADVLNRHLVPRLFRWNTFPITEHPVLQPKSLGRVDLKELGDYITSLSGIGYDLFPNEALAAALLQAADLPERSPDEQDELDAQEEQEPDPPPSPPPPPGDGEGGVEE